jgi:hypothetical protein
MTTEEMALDVLNYCEKFKLDFMKLNATLKLAMSINTAAGYGK